MARRTDSTEFPAMNRAGASRAFHQTECATDIEARLGRLQVALVCGLYCDGESAGGVSGHGWRAASCRADRYVRGGAGVTIFS